MEAQTQDNEPIYRDIEIPPGLYPVFIPPRGSLAYRGAYGGRGSAKTRTFAKMIVRFVIQMDSEGLSGSVVCGREFMGSLADSSMEEIKSVILEDEWVASKFEVGKEYIRTKSGRIKFLFVGLRHNLDSLKSKARVLLTWIDEAENVSEVAWRKLIATVMREPLSEIWLTWNPESPDSATHKRFRLNSPDKSIIVELNYTGNPWFPEGLERERLDDLKYRPDVYPHIWEGQFLTMTAAQVFAGKYKVEEFEPGAKWDGPYQGGDFGYSQDPTAAIRAYINDGCLYISHEAGGLGIELDDIPARVSVIPDFAKYVTRWDSAQPSMISHIRRKGLDRSEGSVKGKGSVEDGVMFIRSFKQVIIHPRCVNTIKEFQRYSWRVDRLSGDILPELEDDWNHYIDALRYALEPILRKGKHSYVGWV